MRRPSCSMWKHQQPVSRSIGSPMTTWASLWNLAGTCTTPRTTRSKVPSSSEPGCLNGRSLRASPDLAREGGTSEPSGRRVPERVKPATTRVVIAREERSRRRQQDTETAGGEAEQHLPWSGEVGDLGGRQQFKLRQPGTIGVGSGQPRLLQREGVVPHLLPGLTEKSLGTGPVERSQYAVEEAAGSAELAILGRHPRGQDVVDAFMITSASLDQRRIGEVVVGDHRKQRLRQGKVDVRVHAEKKVLKRVRPLGGRECQSPGPRRRYTR